MMWGLVWEATWHREEGCCPPPTIVKDGLSRVWWVLKLASPQCPTSYPWDKSFAVTCKALYHSWANPSTGSSSSSQSHGSLLLLWTVDDPYYYVRPFNALQVIICTEEWLHYIYRCDSLLRPMRKFDVSSDRLWLTGNFIVIRSSLLWYIGSIYSGRLQVTFNTEPSCSALYPLSTYLYMYISVYSKDNFHHHIMFLIQIVKKLQWWCCCFIFRMHDLDLYILTFMILKTLSNLFWWHILICWFLCPEHNVVVKNSSSTSETWSTLNYSLRTKLVQNVFLFWCAWCT